MNAAVALADIRHLAIRRTDGGKTMLLVGGIFAVVGIATYAIVHNIVENID